MSVQPSAMRIHELLYCVLNLWQIWFDLIIGLRCCLRYTAGVKMHKNDQLATVTRKRYP